MGCINNLKPTGFPATYRVLLVTSADQIHGQKTKTGGVIRQMFVKIRRNKKFSVQTASKTTTQLQYCSLESLLCCYFLPAKSLENLRCCWRPSEIVADLYPIYGRSLGLALQRSWSRTCWRKRAFHGCKNLIKNVIWSI